MPDVGSTQHGFLYQRHHTVHSAAVFQFARLASYIFDALCNSVHFCWTVSSRVLHCVVFAAHALLSHGVRCSAGSCLSCVSSVVCSIHTSAQGYIQVHRALPEFWMEDPCHPLFLFAMAAYSVSTAMLPALMLHPRQLQRDSSSAIQACPDYPDSECTDAV